MRTFIFLLVAVLVLFGFLYSIGWPPGIHEATAPTFADYPATITSVTPAPVDFDSAPDARTFTTRITNGAAEGPNFAGHYTVISWGCGTSCLSYAIVDAQSGAIISYGLGSQFGASYQLNSRLLILDPPDLAPTQDIFPYVPPRYFELVNDALVPLPVPSSSPEQGAACTLDAKQCSDGSYVGRIPPDCDFEPCPTE